MTILGYAHLDLALTPGLHLEDGFSVHVDFARMGELLHWGGRLLNEGALGLLAFNAIIVGGLASLAALWLYEAGQRIARRLRHESRKDAPAGVEFGSAQPPAE